MRKSFHTKKIITALLLACISAVGCHPAYKATATQDQIKKSLCAEEWLQFPNQAHPMFEVMPGSVSEVPAGVILPKKYTRYRVNQDTLKALFAYLNAGTKGGIILPVGQQCEPFNLQVSSAMSSALRAKYPEVISLQGNGVNNKAADARLEWNNSQMRGQITYNGAIFYIMPITENNNISYLVYNRDDSNEVKQPFETKPAQPAKIYYDR